jgi:propionyl-CoA carboxylase beta subunit
MVRREAPRRTLLQARISRSVIRRVWSGSQSDPDKIAKRTREYEDRFLSPFIAAERGYIDDVIMPHSTRKRIARALAMPRDKRSRFL